LNVLATEKDVLPLALLFGFRDHLECANLFALCLWVAGLLEYACDTATCFGLGHD
jgi:hypothetical protein